MNDFLRRMYIRQRVFCVDYIPKHISVHTSDGNGARLEERLCDRTNDESKTRMIGASKHTSFIYTYTLKLVA